MTTGPVDKNPSQAARIMHAIEGKGNHGAFQSVKLLVREATDRKGVSNTFGKNTCIKKPSGGSGAGTESQGMGELRGFLLERSELSELIGCGALLGT